MISLQVTHVFTSRKPASLPAAWCPAVQLLGLLLTRHWHELQGPSRFWSLMPCGVGMPGLFQEAGLLENPMTTNEPCFPVSSWGQGWRFTGLGAIKVGSMVRIGWSKAIFTERGTVFELCISLFLPLAPHLVLCRKLFLMEGCHSISMA